MNRVSEVWSRMGLQLKLQLLIQGFLLVVLLSAQQWLLSQFEQRARVFAEDRTLAVADGAINGLNTLMVTKLGREDVISDAVARALFIQNVAQMGEVITQMDQATQQNAALVQEMAAAADSLKSQASELVQAVSVFKLQAGN